MFLLLRIPYGFLLLAVLIGVQCYLICISLINEVDYLLAIRMSSLEKTVYFPSVHLKNRVIWLFAIELY